MPWDHEDPGPRIVDEVSFSGPVLDAEVRQLPNPSDPMAVARELVSDEYLVVCLANR